MDSSTMHQLFNFQKLEHGNSAWSLAHLKFYSEVQILEIQNFNLFFMKLICICMTKKFQYYSYYLWFLRTPNHKKKEKRERKEKVERT